MTQRETPLRRYMIKQLATIVESENISDSKLEKLFSTHVSDAEKKIEKFNSAMLHLSEAYQDRMAGVGMGNYVVDDQEHNEKTCECDCEPCKKGLPCPSKKKTVKISEGWETAIDTAVRKLIESKK